MDDPDLDPSEHRRALGGLARLNVLSRADVPLWRAIRSRQARRGGSGPIRLLDVASGSGDVLLRVCRRATREGIDVIPCACDISPEACAAAKARAERAGMRLETCVVDVLREPLPGGFDVVISSLFLHHLSEAEAVGVLIAMRRASMSGFVVVSDLARSRLGLGLACVAPRLMTRSFVVHIDAVRSVRAGWTRDELRTLFAGAGMRDPVIRRVWPERWLAVWEGA